MHCSADTVGVICTVQLILLVLLPKEDKTRNANETCIRILKGRNYSRGAYTDGTIKQDVARVWSELKWISSWISRGLLLRPQ